MIARTECKYCQGGLEFDTACAGEAINCPHCGKPIVLKLPSIAPVPSEEIDRAFKQTVYPKHLFEKKKFPWKKTLVFFLVIPVSIVSCFFIFLAAMALITGTDSSSSDSSSQPSHTSHTVNAGFRTSVTELIVENKDSEDWKDMTIYINGMPPWGYKCSFKSLAAGHTGRLPLVDFTKDSGERFQPLAMAVKEVWIGGSGYDYEKYGF